MAKTCTNLQKSLDWCEGTPSYAGIRRKLYYISKGQIVKWPTMARDESGRATGATYTGNFELAEAAKWQSIEIDPAKSQLTSEAQGEVPSQTQLNKLVAVHPAVDEEAAALALYVNNNDNVYIVEDMAGKYRVIGCQNWPTKSTVSQDNGQGATGVTSTTLNVEASDEMPAPFYTGQIDTEGGIINPALP